jgi:hypothetical protein
MELARSVGLIELSFSRIFDGFNVLSSGELTKLYMPLFQVKHRRVLVWEVGRLEFWRLLVHPIDSITTCFVLHPEALFPMVLRVGWVDSVECNKSPFVAPFNRLSFWSRLGRQFMENA